MDTGGATPAAVPIDHLIVMFLENRSFDHLYG
jgi:phospholipase C